LDTINSIFDILDLNSRSSISLIKNEFKGYVNLNIGYYVSTI